MVQIIVYTILYMACNKLKAEELKYAIHTTGAPSGKQDSAARESFQERVNQPVALLGLFLHHLMRSFRDLMGLGM